MDPQKNSIKYLKEKESVNKRKYACNVYVFLQYG